MIKTILQWIVVIVLIIAAIKVVISSITGV